MPYNEASKAASMRYAAKHYKRVPLDLKHKDYEELQAHAQAKGESVNGYIKRAIRETMERDKEKAGD